MTNIPRAGLSCPSLASLDWPTLTKEQWSTLTSDQWSGLEVDPGCYFIATYDAWNRLVNLVDAGSGQTVQQNQYDARTFRTMILSYTGGVLSETRHSYFTSDWRCIEERTTGTTAERQFVWGVRYIDDLVLRDRGLEQLYGLQDANWNVTSIIDKTGMVQERCAYSAYGTPIFLTSNFGARSASSFAWETLYCNYRFDSGLGLFLVRNRIYHPAIGNWCQRDPLGYVDGPNMYAASFVPGGTDPSGTDNWGGRGSFSPPSPQKSCIFSMDASDADCNRWETECRKLQTALPGAAYYRRVQKQSSILNRIKQNKCCDVRMVGHQGGSDPANGGTNGGIVTYLDDGSKSVILPDPAFESQLKAAFKANGCTSCTITIYACGGNKSGASATRTGIANSTGCTVNGAVHCLELEDN